MNEEKIIGLFQAVVLDILFDVHSIEDIRDDKQRAELLAAIINRLDSLGIVLTDIIPKEIATQYAGGMSEASRLIIEASGMSESDLKTPAKRIHMEAVDALVSDTMSDLTAAIRTAGENAAALIEDVVRTEIGKGLITGDDSRRIGAVVAEEFSNRGLTAFVTSDGKNLPLNFYASTVVRTKMKEAHTTGAVNRYTENGVEYVQINEHSPTCHVCASRNGLVVSLGDNDQGYPTSAQTGLPPFHPNCRHTIRPYMIDFKTKTELKRDKKAFKPDKDPRTEAQKEAYRSEQGIRRLAAKERKDYDRMKAALGDEAPKTIGAYRRMKRKNDQAWKDMQERFKMAIDASDAEQEPKPKKPRKPRLPKEKPPQTPQVSPETAPEPGAWVKAKSKKEAQKWAMENLKHVREVDYSKYDLQLANEVNRQMHYLQSRYPEVTTKYLGSDQTRNKKLYDMIVHEYTIQLMDAGYSRENAVKIAKRKAPKFKTSPDSIASSSNHTWRKYEGICFNDKFSKDFEYLKGEIKRSVDMGWAPENCEDPISVFTHEYGHQIDNFLTRHAGDLRRYVIDDLYQSWVEEGKRQQRKSLFTDYRQDSLSGYAKTNDKEFFAEAFREYIHNPNPRPVAAEVGRRLEEAMQKWRAQNG